MTVLDLQLAKCSASLVAIPATLPTEQAPSETTPVEATVNLLSLMLAVFTGAVVGLIAAVVVLTVLRVLGRHRDYYSLTARRARTPLITSLSLVGAYFGLRYAQTNLADPTGTWLSLTFHILLICVIMAFTGLAFKLAHLVEDIPESLYGRGDPTRARRVATQAQILRRVAQFLIVIVGVIAVAFTFPAARLAMTSILASAGLISLVAGLAAQSSLANMFAGIQLAITDAIRVGDIVELPSLDGARTRGTIEEITLTYVVMRIWDERRLVIPSSHFTQNRFENLTRTHTQMLGTVELHLDFVAPVSQIRQRLDQILATTDLWDGRTANVQVTDCDANTMLVRVVVSAANTGNLWDLRCYVREQLISWIYENAAYALPRTRIVPEEVVEVGWDVSEEKIAELAEELAGLSAGENGEVNGASALPSSPDTVAREILYEADAAADNTEKPGESPSHRARLRAAKLRSIRAVTRRSIIQETGEATSDRTQLLQLPNPPSETTGTQDRLYSGSPDADERGRAFSGPGEQALHEREENAARQRSIEEHKK